MSRVLKFRIWDKANKEYKILGATGLDARNGDVIDYYNEGNRLGGPEEYDVEQYTGLKDKNGKEIYEGDIVKFGCGDQTPAEVVYQDGSYFIKALDDGTLFYDPDANKPCPFGWFETCGLEVIGNIHENKELWDESV